MSELKKEFFMSQIKIISDIKETEKIKLSLVYYEVTKSTCVLRVCKNRDLSEVCKLLMEVRHPNIVVTYDYVYIDGDTYIIEEYISGRSLEEIIEEDGVFLEDDTAQIITKVCEGLEQLHSLQPPLVHNDIKTLNIMIKDDGSVKLFDFDISRLYKSGASKNTVLFGTEGYAAPEHFGYGQSEPRTDIYSIGVTMHRMLTGESLDNEHKSIYNGSLKKIINKCIQIAPEKRYATVSLLKKDLNKNRKKAIMPIKGVAIATLLIIILTGGVALWRNTSVDSAHGNLENTSDGYKDIWNETQKDSQEIDTTKKLVEIEGTTKDTTEEITTDAKEEITTDIKEETTTDATEEITTDAKEETTTDAKEETTTDTIEEITTNTKEEKTTDATEEITTNTKEDTTEEKTTHVHDIYLRDVVEATCTQDGYTINICACGDRYIDDVVKGGHIWTKATCEKVKKCERCGIEEGEVLEHDYEKYVCTMCGEKDEEGYALATKPELHLKKGEFYSQVIVTSSL